MRQTPYFAPIELIEALISARDTIDMDDDGAYSSLLALSQVAIPTALPEVKKRTLDAMKSATYEFKNPEITKKAQELIASVASKI